LENWVFGCDICQDVCPWNRFARQHDEPRFQPLNALLGLSAESVSQMSNSQFDKRLKANPMSRIRRPKFLSNLAATKGEFFQDLTEVTDKFNPTDKPPTSSENESNLSK
jgi:epoxyqueuosine reductase